MEEDSNDSWIYLKLIFIWLASKITYSYHEMAGNVLVTLSICYVVMKIIKEFKPKAK